MQGVDVIDQFSCNSKDTVKNSSPFNERTLSLANELMSNRRYSSSKRLGREFGDVVKGLKRWMLSTPLTFGMSTSIASEAFNIHHPQAETLHSFI